MQRPIVEPKKRSVIYRDAKIVDAETGFLILLCPVCKRWFLTSRIHTVTCGDACRKALSRERKAK